MMFSDEELERYHRNMALKEIGAEGQAKIRAGRVLIAGAGGLGSPAALYLAAAGVGKITIVDPDNVDLSNLQRQIAHGMDDIGRPKAESAADAVRALNPNVEAVPVVARLSAANVMDFVQNCDFVIDGTDNFPAKFLLNDACVIAKKPLCHAGLLGFSGQVATFLPGGGACYRCVFREPPPQGVAPSCRRSGILGALAGVIGSLQSLEALKYLTGVGDLLSSRMMSFDALKNEWRSVRLPADPACPVCGANPSILIPFDSSQPQCR